MFYNVNISQEKIISNITNSQKEILKFFQKALENTSETNLPMKFTSVRIISQNFEFYFLEFP